MVLTTEVCSKNKYFSYFEYAVQVLNPFHHLKNISKAIKSSSVDSLLYPFAFSLDFKMKFAFYYLFPPNQNNSQGIWSQFWIDKDIKVDFIHPLFFNKVLILPRSFLVPLSSLICPLVVPFSSL